MKVKVRPMRHQGRNMHQKEMMERPPIVGELVVSEARDPELQRAVMRARLLDISKGTKHDLLPQLSDAQLRVFEGKTMRLTGFEQIDKAAFAQTWSVEVA
jgi:hypothetical protein